MSLAGCQLPVESLTVELRVVATKTADGKAGFSVPIINIELGGSGGWQHETTPTNSFLAGPFAEELGGHRPQPRRSASMPT
jgi:hypothetical protein